MKRIWAALVASFLVHGVLAATMGRLPRRSLLPRQQVSVTVDYATPPPEPPKAPPPPPPPPVKMPRALPKRVARASLPPPRVPQPPAPQDAPPPPTKEAKDPTPQPLIVTGITLESTTSSGGMAVGVGNTLRGAPSTTAAAPETVKPYKAARYATSAQVNELPGVLNRDALDIKRYYPPAALKKEFEGDVVLRLLIDSDGTIAKVDVVNDPGEGLGAAAARAVRQLRFSPGKVDGEAVATTIPFTIRFVIN
jgi:protein TonB